MEMNMEGNQNKYRFEKKFVVSRTRLNSVLYELKTSRFFKMYPNRIVNSIYFDDKYLSAYYENLEGLSERTKYRFRFYGNFAKKNISGKFERKIKNNDVNFKLSESKKISFENIYKIKFPNKKNLSPNIHTKYQRYYFFNRFKNIRCTVDVGLKIINVKNKLVKRFSDIIIEFKCDKKIIVNDVVKNANYNIRCSKYCIGIDLHNLAYEKY